MRRIITRLTFASLAVVASATLGYAQTSGSAQTTGSAQTSEIRGTVQRVDVSSGTVYFTDGRAVKLDPQTRLYVGSREVRLADVQPGWTFVSSTATTTPGGVVVYPCAPPVSVSGTPSSASSTSASTATPASVPSVPPPTMAPTTSRIDATGVVANVDAATGTITLQDGRVIRMVPGTTVWQPVSIGGVVPGASVFVRSAQPLDFRPSGAPPAGSTTVPPGTRPFQMGTVSNVDASNARVVLSDGTVVHLRPGSRLTFNGQSMTISDLRPGDEVVVGVPASSPVAVTSTGPALSALPRQTLGVTEGEHLYVVRRPQSP